jgi:hypothetical protein
VSDWAQSSRSHPKGKSCSAGSLPLWSNHGQFKVF